MKNYLSKILKIESFMIYIKSNLVEDYFKRVNYFMKT